jgi:ribosomal protein S18 acetylase RimI-like enzyme
MKSDNIIINDFQTGRENLVCDFVKKVFDEFVAPDYSEEGNNTFYDYIDPVKMKERISSGKTFILLAEEGENIAGMIEMRDFNHISLLFVDRKYQGQGIAKDLYDRAIKICRENSNESIEFTVNSSPFAVEIYEKLGFIKTEDEKITNGIRYIPMKMLVEKLR